MNKKRIHFNNLQGQLGTYAESRSLDFQTYSPYHMRLMDGGFSVLDIWTTGRYYALTTDYSAMELGYRVTERGGEKGTFNLSNDYEKDLTYLSKWLDNFFFPQDVENHTIAQAKHKH